MKEQLYLPCFSSDGEYNVISYIPIDSFLFVCLFFCLDKREKWNEHYKLGPKNHLIFNFLSKTQDVVSLICFLALLKVCLNQSFFVNTKTNRAFFFHL